MFLNIFISPKVVLIRPDCILINSGNKIVQNVHKTLLLTKICLWLLEEIVFVFCLYFEFSVFHARKL